MDPKLVILQPTPYCNIACTYCYLSNRDDRTLMSDEILQCVRNKIITKLPRNSTCAIVWHAGEPTAVPPRWYERAHNLLEPVRPLNSNFAMQTNGIAIDDRWISLFRRTKMQVSLSIDGPERFHDARRLTRNGRPTWHLALRGLKRMQDAGFNPRVISVLHPTSLSHPEEYFEFFRSNDIFDVSFSFDEQEGANANSSFGKADHKHAFVDFLVSMLELAFQAEYPLSIKEVDRIAGLLVSGAHVNNELAEAWATLVVAANGNVSTYSPEFMEVLAPKYNNFVFGNIVTDDMHSLRKNKVFQMASFDIAAGTSACGDCRYFQVCGGGSPVNKYCEKGNLTTTETTFCRLTTQASADALLEFLSRHRNKGLMDQQLKADFLPTG